jgi:hypothetical protein
MMKIFNTKDTKDTKEWTLDLVVYVKSCTFLRSKLSTVLRRTYGKYLMAVTFVSLVSSVLEGL